MELQGTSTTPHRLKRRIQPTLAATDGGKGTFNLIYGLDPGSHNSATTAAITVPTIQLHRGPQQHLQSRRHKRPQPVSFSVTDAAQLSRTLSEMGSGSGIPEATYSELAAILLSSGRRDQAVDISSEVIAISEGCSLSRGPGGSAPPSAWKRARRGPTTNTLGLTAHLRAAYWAFYPKT